MGEVADPAKDAEGQALALAREPSRARDALRYLPIAKVCLKILQAVISRSFPNLSRRICSASSWISSDSIRGLLCCMIILRNIF